MAQRNLDNQGELSKTRVFIDDTGQTELNLAEFRFAADDVCVRQDPQNFEVIRSQPPGDWQSIFAALDEAGFPDDFLTDRG